jgi:hypothetical protein
LLKFLFDEEGCGNRDSSGVDAGSIRSAPANQSPPVIKASRIRFTIEKVQILLAHEKFVSSIGFVVGAVVSLSRMVSVAVWDSIT